METAVVEMLKRSAAIPSIPQVAARFLELIQDPDFDYRDVVEVLSADPGTASEILRLANSSLFGVTRHVSSLPHALTLLGMRRVRSLVLGRYIVDSIDRKTHTSIPLPYFWSRSLACAVLSGQLAAVLDPQVREEAFISGLLADIGMIILEEAMPSDYEPIASDYRPDGPIDLAKQEESQLGINHGQASALVLTHWQLPELVCEAVRWHPWELECMEAPPLSRMVGAADCLAKLFTDGSPDVARAVEFCTQVEAALHVPRQEFIELLTRLEPHMAEFAEMLRINLTGSQNRHEFTAALVERLTAEQPMPAL